MRLKKYMINELSLPSWITSLFSRIKKELSKMSYTEFERKCKKSFDEVIEVIDKDELSYVLKKMGIDEPAFRSLFKEGVVMTEDAKHWWELIKTEAFPTLAFYPALQVWLEFDKMLKGTEYSGKVVAFYAAFWLLLVSGKYVKGWLDWKKTNKSEYEQERSIGKGGLI